MRITITYIVFFLFTSLLFSNEVRVVNSAITNFPERLIEFYYYNEEQQLVNNLTKDDISLQVDGQSINNFSFQPTDNLSADTLSIVFSIDISEQNSVNIPEIRNSINQLSKYVLNDKVKFAIQVYNSQSYILQNFTSELTDINRALNLLTPFGIANYNIAFLSPKSGSIDLAKNSRTKSIIINFSQGNALGDSTSIVNSATPWGIEIYNLSFDSNIAPKLKSISNLTGGQYFDNCNASNLLNRLLYISNKSSNLKAYQLTYNYNNCSLESKIKVFVNSDISDEYSALYSLNKLPRLELKPQEINFGVVVIGQNKLDSFSIIARNSDVLLEDIIFNSADYQITPNYKNILIKKNTEIKFYIKLNSNTTKYKYSKLEFITDACSKAELELLSGSNEEGSENSELKLIYPNGKEVFYSGEIIDIEWKGVLDTQAVVLEYSTDNGSNWETITENARNKSYKWIVPNLQSNRMLIRVDLPSGDLKYEKIKYVVEPEKSKKIEAAILSKDKNYAGISFDDGSIFIWDIANDKIKRQLRDKNIGIKTFDIAFGRITNLFAASLGNNGDYDVVIWSADTSDFVKSRSFNVIPKSIDWSPSDTKLYIGLGNGDLVIWDLIKDELETLHSYAGSIDNIALNTEKELIALSDGGTVIFANLFGDSLASISLPDSILDMNWSPVGDKFYAVYDFSDLRVFNITNVNGNININQNTRIIRNTSTNIISAEWIDNNSLILISKNNKNIEYWGVDGTKLLDFKVHSTPLNSIFAMNTTILSAQDTNYALVWNINDYPFDYDLIDSDISDDNWTIVKKEIQKQKIVLGDLCLNFPYYFVFNNVYKNLNEPNIKIDSIVSSTDEIRVLNEFPINLGNNESLELKFNFLPTRDGTFENKLFIYHGAVKDTLTIRSRNVKANFSILNKSYTFENVLVNSTQTKNLSVLRNLGQNQIKFDSLEILFGNDLFEIINSNYKVINPSEDLFIEIAFSPKAKGNYSGLIKLVSKQLCSPIYISLSGSAYEPIIRYSETIDFGVANCKNQLDTNIYIKNLSLNSIELKSSAIVGSQNFSITNDNLPIILKTGDSTKITLSFLDGELGNYSSVLEILTNLSGENKKLTINLLAKRDSVNLQFIDSRLDFGSINSGQTPSKTLQVINTSLIPYTFTLPKAYKEFELISADPITIATDDTSTLTIKYIGTNTDTTINLLFPIGIACNSDISLPISISISNGSAEISYENESDLGEIECAIRHYFKHTIKNTGESNLIISNIVFEGQSSSGFRLEKDYKGQSIEPNKSIEIEYSYLPSIEGVIDANLIIESNASNSDGGRNSIKLLGNYVKTELQLSIDTLRFEGLRSNRKYNKQITIKNTGSSIVILKFQNDANFVVDSIVPQIISPGEVATVYITFVGGNVETKYSGIIKFSDDCLNEYNLYLSAEVGGSDYISIQPEKIISETGRVVNINIKFENTSNIAIPQNDTIQTKLIFNSTLMVPLDKKYEGTINSKGERVINITFPLKDEAYIYRIPAVITLGDTSYSSIRLEQSTHLNNEFYIDDFNRGSITVTNIVKEPNDRFIYGKGRAYLSGTIPSPVTDNATIKYGVIESTKVNISVYDILGNKVMVLVDGYKTPGEYDIKINPQSLSSGNYLYKLETPSMRIIKKLTIIR